MNYCNIKYYDIANGEGVRLTLFVSGCRNHCKGCFQPETWDFNYGNEFTKEIENNIMEELSNWCYDGLTLLGGDPFEPENQKVINPFLKRVKNRFPEKNIWCYTGYKFDEDIVSNMFENWSETKELMSYIDVLVDGKFEEDKKDIALRFRGSSNQRILDAKKSVKEGKAVLFDL